MISSCLNLELYSKNRHLKNEQFQLYSTECLHLINSLSPWVTLGVAQRDLGGIQFITRRNCLHQAARRHPSTPFQYCKERRGWNSKLQITLSKIRIICCMKKKADVGMVEGWGLRGYLLVLVVFTLQLKSLVLNKGNTSYFSGFMDSDPILQVFHHLQYTW